MIKLLCHKDKKEYMELFDRYFSEFINTIQENMPKAKIVLVKGRYAHSYIDDEHIIRYMDAQKFSYTDRENRHWKELNDYIEEKYNLESIDMTENILQILIIHLVFLLGIMKNNTIMIL